MQTIQVPRQKSIGHIGFTETHEYFKYSTDVYRAQISDYIGTDGIRSGARFESTVVAWNAGGKNRVHFIRWI